MPELPEIEIIKNELAPKLINRRIIEIYPYSKKSFKGQYQTLIQREIISVQRRGKVLILILDDEKKLSIHLRLTGQLLLEDEKGNRWGGGHPGKEMLLLLPNNTTRIKIQLSDSTLYFNDRRKFGFFCLLKPGENDPLLEKMGPEPLSQQLTLQYLEKKQSQKYRCNIKSFLLDQKNIAGIGNIYADETLFLSGIHPLKKFGEIPKKYLQKVLNNLRIALKRGIQFGGVTYKIYSDRKEFEEKKERQLYVYGRTGKPCKLCNTPIKKIKVAGRGTHFCPKCQPEIT